MPVGNASLMSSLRARTQLATEIDQCEHRARKVTSKQRWLNKAADDVGVELDGLR
jgi:hypothetical protein